MKICKKYLIADALLNYSKNSITEFIETSEDSELSKLAKEKNIVIPSPDLLLFRTIYAKCGEPNRNGVIINKEPVEKALLTLISKQINLEHEGKNWVCGHILDAKLENEYIVIYGVFYKSLFQEEYETLKNLFVDKKVYVSFEIWSKDPETGKSVIHNLENGIREINPIIFHGCGLLMENLPACKEAILDKILGQKEIENLQQITNKVFNEDLVYASFDYKESKCMHCQKCTCEEKEDKKLELLENKEVKVEAQERLCSECKQPLKDDEKDLCAECLKKKNIPAEESKTEEVKVEETKAEVVKEENQVTPEPVQVTEPAVEQKPDEQAQVVEQPAEVKKEEVIIVTYTEEQLTAKVNEAKVELQKVIDDKDKEITQLKQELAAKAQEKQTTEAKVNEDEGLTVGNVEKDIKDNETKEIERRKTEIARIINEAHKR
jgi:hypothetical protein